MTAYFLFKRSGIVGIASFHVVTHKRGSAGCCRQISDGHDLRHTHATMLGRASGDPRIVQRQLGHTYIATSMGYVSTDDAETIAAVEKIAPLTERKVVSLNADAGCGTQPPSMTAITDVASDASA